MISLDVNPKILVVGDLMVDHYLWGSCSRVSPEAPVQIIDIDHDNSVLGGAGNVLKNLKALGAQADVISVIGDCPIAYELKMLTEEIQITSDYIFTQKNRKTSKKSRIIATQQQVIRFDQESCDDIDIASHKLILKTFSKILSNYDLVLLSDYGKGVLTPNLTKSIIEIANNSNKKVLVDPKGSDFSKYKGAYLLTPNLKEASEAFKMGINDEKSLLNAISSIKKELELNFSLITMSEKGIALYDEYLRIHPTSAREVYDVTGAGDTVLAALGVAIACNMNIDSAVDFANLAAGVVVSKIGSATATIEEINQYESKLNSLDNNSKIRSLDEIKIISSEFKSKEKKIVFTNGCFDILHLGHISYLKEAKKLGDILIVGLNSDNSVRELKGNSRPINNEHDRALILAALGVVDFVVIFEEDNPGNLIKSIKPDFLVKGGDYKNKYIIGTEFANEIKIVEFLAGRSSSLIIDKIKQG
jgi:D-beta-D-heptose 7-phosphate kinase / D-beta-D-heptose 1-phosphate adenosyltransferase